MTTLRGQFTALLEPILDDVWNDAKYPRAPQLYQRLYAKVKTSGKAGETIYNRTGLGAFQDKPEAQPITFSDPIGGSEIKFTHVRRGLAYNISQEALDHDQFSELVGLEQDLRIAAQDDLEVRGHLLLNSGFGTTNAGGFRAAGYDALALFSTAHTRLDGGATQRNRPSTDVNLSWAALADARQQFKIWLDDRGRPVMGTPVRLWVAPQDELTALEIVRSTQKPGTPNNDTNVLSGEFEVIVSQYITDTNSWFLQGNRADTVWYWDTTAGTRVASLMDDELREISGRKAVHGFSHGHGNWFDFYGTSGTT